MNHKLFTAAALSTAAIVAVVAPSASASFNDVAPNTELELAINSLVERQIVSGYPNQTFQPNASLQRSHAAKIIAGALGLDVENVINPNFKDIPVTHPEYKYIAALENNGIISGTGNGNFSPTDKLTRGQMAKIISNAYQLKGSSELPFSDTEENYFESDIAKIYANGITQGVSSTKFGVNNLVTRGQLAIFVYRTEQKIEAGEIAKPNHVYDGKVKIINDSYITINGADYGFNQFDIIPLDAIIGLGVNVPADSAEFDYKKALIEGGALSYFAMIEYNSKTDQYNFNHIKYFKLENISDDDLRSYRLTELTKAYEAKALFTIDVLEEKLFNLNQIVVKDKNRNVIDPSHYTVTKYDNFGSYQINVDLHLPDGEYFISYPYGKDTFEFLYSIKRNGAFSLTSSKLYIEDTFEGNNLPFELIGNSDDFSIFKSVSVYTDDDSKAPLSLTFEGNRFKVKPTGTGKVTVELNYKDLYDSESNTSTNEWLVEAYGNGYTITDYYDALYKANLQLPNY